MANSYMKSLILCALIVSSMVSAKKKKSSSTKLFSIYTDADHQGIELAVCNELAPSLVQKRTHMFEKEGEFWGHLAEKNTELRVWLMNDISAETDGKARSNFLSALRMISNANHKFGSQFFNKDRSRLTFAIDGWESKKAGPFVFETEGKLFRGEGKTRSILKQSNIHGKPFIKPHEVTYSK